jgi:hypothetical protein
MAVSVAYYARGAGIQINGSATAPTAVQASSLQELVCLVTMNADADTQALLTHNFGFDASGPTYLDNPQILGPIGYGVPGTATTFMPAFSFDITNTNVVKMNKLNSLGTNGTWIVTLRRPFAPSR